MAPEPNTFLWVGNDPGLDLVNTDAVDANGDPLELVPDWPALVDWARAAGLIDDELTRECRATSDRRARTVLAWFRRLRSALRAVLESGDEPDAAETLAAAVGAVPVRLTYRPDRPGGGPLTRPDRSTGCGSPSPPPPSTPRASNGHACGAAGAPAACCSTTTPPRTGPAAGATWRSAATGPSRPRTTTARSSQRSLVEG